jgi:mannose/fructose/N-acetylgalactosamine-specific phosphotransferase system component IID
MAYLNELGEPVGCTTSFSAQVANFFSVWYFTILPLIVLIVLFFVLKKYVKDKRILIAYAILAILAYAWWLPKTFIFCV